MNPINIERLAEYPLLAIDVETTGLHWYRDKLFGVAIAALDPVSGKEWAGYWDIRNKPGVINALQDQMGRVKRLINHHIKFDSHFLRQAGVTAQPQSLECTMVRAALIDEHRKSYSLDSCGFDYVGERKVDIWGESAQLCGGAPTKDAQIKNLHRLPVSLAAKYAIADPMIALKLWVWQEKEIEKQGLQKVWNLERQLTPVLVDIESNGVRVDEQRAYDQIKVAEEKIHAAQKALDKLAGKSVNANSPPQMRGLFGAEKREGEDGRVYWVTSSGFRLETTGGGEASIGKDSLRTMAELGDKRAEHVLLLRRMLKAKSFMTDHVIGHAVNGRVFCNYNQTRGDNDLGTKTGRFSIDDPALQQIPARDKDVAAIVRAIFLPEFEETWACADWEQFEFRWFAHYTKDAQILKTYAEDPNTDFHQVVSDITGIARNARYAGDANAKQINLGLVFGMGRGEMAYQMGLEYTTRMGRDGREWKNAGPAAEAIFDKYHGAIPGVRQLLDEAASIARNRGYVRTVMDRHIRFPGGKFTHKAGGLTFQGTSADCMKQKMIELHPVSKKEGFKILLSVHDELDFSFPPKEAKRMAAMVKSSLECFDGVGCPIKCRVPIRSSVALGPNWWEASK